MAKLTGREAAEKHARNLQNALPDIQRGIERVSVSPTEMAAKKEQKLVQNFMASVQSGKWAEGLRRVSLDDWKKAAVQKGLPRISAGVEASKEKTAEFYDELFQYQDRVSAKIQTMPDLTLQDNINRMVEQVRAMSEFRRTK